MAISDSPIFENQKFWKEKNIEYKLRKYIWAIFCLQISLLDKTRIFVVEATQLSFARKFQLNVYKNGQLCDF